MIHNRLLDLEVDVATLRRRLAVLELRMTGKYREFSTPLPLFALYSHLLMDGLELNNDTCTLLCTLVYSMTPRALLDLCRYTNDMFAWRPLLAALDQLSASGHDTSHVTPLLEEAITELMKAQGLGALRIEDVIYSPVGPLTLMKKTAMEKRKKS